MVFLNITLVFKTQLELVIHATVPTYLVLMATRLAICATLKIGELSINLAGLQMVWLTIVHLRSIPSPYI